MDPRNAKRLVLGLGAVQIVTAIAMALGAAWFHSTYGRAAEQVAYDLRDATRIASTHLSALAARTVEERATLQLAVKALRDLQLLRVMSDIAAHQERQLPLYARDFRSAGVLVSRIGVQFAKLQAPLEFSIPRFKGWEGVKPVFEFTKPLSKEADEMAAIGKDLQNLGEGLQRAANDIDKDGESLRKELVDSLQRSQGVLRSLEASLQSIEQRDVPQLSETLKRGAQALENASQHAASISAAFIAISVVALMLALLFFCNAVITMASLRAVESHLRSQSS